MTDKPETAPRPANNRQVIKASEAAPKEYLIHIKPFKCLSCLAESESYDVFLVRIAAKHRDLVPVRDANISPHLPIGASRLPLRLTPFCPKCYQTRETATMPAVSEQRWQEAARKAQEHAERKGKLPSTTPVKPTISLNDIPKF